MPRCVGTLAAGTAYAQGLAKPELKVGFVPGPYIDGFKAGVAPELQKKGYRIRYVEFSTGLEANNAVFKGEIDANVMQHTIFLNSYNDRQQTDLVGIVHVPLGRAPTIVIVDGVDNHHWLPMAQHKSEWLRPAVRAYAFCSTPSPASRNRTGRRQNNHRGCGRRCGAGFFEFQADIRRVAGTLLHLLAQTTPQ